MDTTPEKRVAQHNALINARFSLVPLQMRLFVALLSRIDFNDVDFKEHFIPLDELVFERRGGSAYEQVDEMCKGLASFTLYIEELEEKTRKRPRQQIEQVVSELLDKLEGANRHLPEEQYQKLLQKNKKLKP